MSLSHSSFISNITGSLLFTTLSLSFIMTQYPHSISLLSLFPSSPIPTLHSFALLIPYTLSFYPKRFLPFLLTVYLYKGLRRLKEHLRLNLAILRHPRKRGRNLREEIRRVWLRQRHLFGLFISRMPLWLGRGVATF